jgi:hypothetical protein
MWGELVRLTPQLRHDMQWWTHVPSQSSVKTIHKPIRTAHIHTDSYGYGWGAILNERLEARGVWSAEDEQQHITLKEFNAVRHDVESFLPQHAGRNVLMYEDSKAICRILTCLTSRSPVMIDELRRLLCLIDTKSINLQARYIRSATNLK